MTALKFHLTGHSGDIDTIPIDDTKIKSARLEADLTQEKLTEKNGLHRTYIAGIETGYRNISGKISKKLLKPLVLKQTICYEQRKTRK